MSRSFLLSLSLSLGLSLTLATAAEAQLTSPPPSGTSHLYSVLGVQNTGSLGTYIECTSTSTDPQTVTVEAFDENGNAAGSGSLVVASGKTVRFGTQDALGLTEDSLLGGATINAGAARVLSTDKRLLCHAQISHVSGIPDPAPITIVAKLKQKAAN